MDRQRLDKLIVDPAFICAFTPRQLKQIDKAYYQGLNFIFIADPRLSATEMMVRRMGMLEELEKQRGI